MTRRLDFPWTAGVVIVAVLATALARPDGLWIADAERVRAGELWRLVTGPFVHATSGHLLRDVALCALVGIAYEHPMRRAWPALCAVTLVVPTVAALAAGWDGYLGLSGASHGLMAAAITFELRRGARWYVVAAAAALAAKVVVEVALAAPLFPMDLGPGVTQAPIAHLAGAVAGACVARKMLQPPRGDQARHLAA